MQLILTGEARVAPLSRVPLLRVNTEIIEIFE